MDRHSVNLNLLAALDALLTERHVGRAATRVGVTQSAMSHTLRQLRELFDDPLLVRSGNAMVPTPRAEAIAPLLYDGLGALDRVLHARAEVDPATLTDTFVIAAVDAIALTFVAPFFARMQRLAPRATIQVVDNPPDIGDALLQGRVQIAFHTAFQSPPGTRSVIAPPVNWAVLGRADHPDLTDPMSLDAFCTLPHVMMTLAGPGTGPSFIDHVLTRLGRERRVALRVPFNLAIPGMLVDTDAISVVVEPVARMHERNWPVRGVRMPVEMNMPDIGQPLIWHERYDADPVQRWFREQLVDAAWETIAQLG